MTLTACRLTGKQPILSPFFNGIPLNSKTYFNGMPLNQGFNQKKMLLFFYIVEKLIQLFKSNFINKLKVKLKKNLLKIIIHLNYFLQ